MLKIIDLKYRHKNADDIYEYSMYVKPKEIVAILGQSGSGKSTLLDLLAGFLHAKSGSIVLDEHELTEESVETRPISILFQNHNLFEHLSVQKNILLGISKTLKSTQEALEKVNKILKEVGLEKYEHTIVSSLSGGQQQRVAIARAVIANPGLILADEPTGNLDSKNGIEVMNLLSELNQEGATIIMVTHSDRDADYANRIINLFDGQVIQEIMN